MIPPPPEYPFLNAMDKVFFDAAYRAFTKKLTSRASLEIPALRAFEHFVTVIPTTLAKQDVIAGIDWEFRKQKEMYDALDELKDHFKVLGASFNIIGPDRVKLSKWVHLPSYGTWLKITKRQVTEGRYPGLYAFPTMPAHSGYGDTGFGMPIYIDEHVTIVAPRGRDDENVSVLNNKKLMVPLSTLTPPLVTKPTGFWSRFKKSVPVEQTLERHNNFLFADIVAKIDEELIEEWKSKYTPDAIVIADRSSKKTSIVCDQILPKLHKEIRKLGRVE